MKTPNNFELFLAHADDHAPFLREGLPSDAAADAPTQAIPSTPEHLAYEGAHEQSLLHQGWGIVAPAGPEGDRLLALIEPLRKHRRAQQGDRQVQIYRVPKDMDEGASARWLFDEYPLGSEQDADRPRYLLLLGDADQISLDFQRLLAASVYVGRLAFPDDRGYASYIGKLLAWERAAAADTARALFYTALDGTAATSMGHAALMTPSIDYLNELRKRGDLHASELVPIDDDRGALLAQASRREPSMMLTISHGLGPPRAGWRSPDDQRARQGAMSLGSGQALTGQDLADKPFLPGGIWFYLACYGAATPTESSYYPWLCLLKEASAYSGQVKAVLAGLPPTGQRPFIAALPQAVLANPDGPLAVIGHSDLAWTCGFQDINATGVRSRAERFERAFRQLIEGGRAGVAHHALAQSFTASAVELSVLDNQRQRAKSRGTALPADAARVRRRSNLWMRLQDISAYILLGDPAARLPIRMQPGGALTPIPGAGSAPVESRLTTPGVFGVAAKPPLETMEEAVVAMIGGNEAPNAIAARYKMSRTELDRFTQTYRDAGREALKRLK